jgi:omega-6 fatty acid desaturase (delta-12 desaturase)
VLERERRGRHDGHDVGPVVDDHIGVHHVHHLNSRIPFYRLPQILEDHPPLRQVQRLTLRQSLACVPLTLWDERTERMVSFRQARGAN